MSAILPENYPELLAEIASAIAVELQKLGAADEAAAGEIGYKVAERVRKAFGGIGVYVPTGHAMELERRDWEIYAKFNGRNYAELALEFSLTEMRIRQIVKACKEEETRRRQAQLFAAE